MPYVIQSTYQQDYTPPNVDRYNVSIQYEIDIKEDAEAQKKYSPPEKNTIEVTKCDPEWTKLERMELIVHRNLFNDNKIEKTTKKKQVIDKPNKFTQKIDKHLCVSPVGYQKCPAEFRSTYQQDYPDLNPDKRSPYDNLVTKKPLQYTELGNIIVPEDDTIAEYTKMCASNRKTFVANNRNEISNALPKGKCICSMTEYQGVIGSMGAILKKTKPVDLTKDKKDKKGKRTCGW